MTNPNPDHHDPTTLCRSNRTACAGVHIDDERDPTRRPRWRRIAALCFMSNILLCAACTDDSVHAEHGREIEGLAVATATPLSLHSSFKARKDMECDPEKVRALVELLEADSEGAESMDLSGEPDIEFRQAFQKRVIEFWKLRLEARDCG